MQTTPMITVKDLLFQAFLTGWERSDRSLSQDAYLESSIHVINSLQVEPELLCAEEGMGLLDGDTLDHLDDRLRADGVWLYYGGGTLDYFLLLWYADAAAAQKKLEELAALFPDGSCNFYAVDMTLRRTNASNAESFGSSSPNHLHS